MIGWVWESIYESILNKKILNRGFLNGPYIPIYGFGGTAILVFLQRFQAPILSGRTAAIFLIGAVGASTLEYLTSYVLEKCLNARWWDYSNYPLNVNGRICLIATVFWGVVAVVAIDLLNPWLLKTYAKFSHDSVLIFVSVMSTLILVDLGITINSLLDLRKRLQLLVSMETDKISELFADRGQLLIKYKEKLENFSNPFTKRIVNAFPKLKFNSDKAQEIFIRIKEFRKK